MANQEQNFANHARSVAPYHYVAFPILLVNFVWAVVGLVGEISFDALLNVLVAVALIIVALFARVFALKAQDRVIRLEMRLRMRELLPEDLQGRINDYTATQMTRLTVRRRRRAAGPGTQGAGREHNGRHTDQEVGQGLAG